MSITIQVVTAVEDIQKCFDIRDVVFVKGQNVPQDLEIDGLDSEAEHFLVLVDGLPAATSRVRYKAPNIAKIERVAVLDDYQGKGLGKKLMLFILEHLKSKNIKSAILGSQVHAIPFYEKLGFYVVSDEYLDADIPHKDMKKDI